MFVSEKKKKKKKKKIGISSLKTMTLLRTVLE